MRTPTHRRLFSLSLAMLLFVPALPAAAGDVAAATGGGFDLHLEEALVLQGASLPFGERAADEDLGIGADGVATPENDFTAAGRESLRQTSTVRLERESAKTDLAQQANRGGTGRWLKKHWYVPVLVAVAAGLALADDGSDGPEDVED